MVSALQAWSPRVMTLFRLGGFDYSDVIHIYGLSRAGYIPQLISLKLRNPNVVYELLGRSSAEALIYDKSFEDTVHCDGAPVALYTACSSKDMESCQSASKPLPEQYEPQSGQEIAFIYHTSGSTSGSPTLVPCDYTYIDAAMKKSRELSIPRSTTCQTVSTWM